jgi:hypothetical protein
VSPVPPCRPDFFLPDFGGATANLNRSPFRVSSLDFVKCYGTSTKRRALIDGLFTYRARLRRLGIHGFQWLNGSFVGDVESRESREPGDIDTVTFWDAAKPQTALLQQDPTLFDHDRVKADHGVDAFPIWIRQQNPWTLLNLACYWHGMWSRSKATTVPVMKGYLVLSLDASDADDTAALKELARSVSP